MSLSHRGFIIVVLLSFFLALAGCEQKGTAEKAGEKVDQAAEKVSEKMEDAKEAIGDKAEKTGEYMNDAAITAKIKADTAIALNFQNEISETRGIFEQQMIEHIIRMKNDLES